MDMVQTWVLAKMCCPSRGRNSRNNKDSICMLCSEAVVKQDAGDPLTVETVNGDPREMHLARRNFLNSSGTSCLKF